MREFNKNDFPVRYGPAIDKIDKGAGIDIKYSMAFACSTNLPNEFTDTNWIGFYT